MDTQQFNAQSEPLPSDEVWKAVEIAAARLPEWVDQPARRPAQLSIDIDGNVVVVARSVVE